MRSPNWWRRARRFFAYGPGGRHRERVQPRRARPRILDVEYYRQRAERRGENDQPAPCRRTVRRDDFDDEG